jgi:beta-glucosidase
MSDFLWGVATAACQVEGGTINSDWQIFTTEPRIRRRVAALRRLGPAPGSPLQPPGDAVGHARLDVLRADLDRARMLGANAYRFSLEWSRLEPAAGEYNEDVLEGYYLKVVEELRARGMEPVVTLQHLSLPAWVLTPPARTRWLGPLPLASAHDRGFQQSLRGWESPATVDAFISFVKRVAPRLRDAGVRYWVTVNEPVTGVVGLGYVAGIWPPGFTGAARRASAAHFNLLRAHVRAYDAIKSADPAALVGFAHAMFPCRPPAGGRGWRARADAGASDQSDYFYNQHFLDSLLTGRVDLALDRRPGHRRYVPAAEFFGLPDSRPRLDYVGVNYYNPYTIRFSPLFAALTPFTGGLVSAGRGPHSGITNDGGFRIDPTGLSDVVRRVHEEYGLPVLVTENGLAERIDRHRAPHIVSHVESLQNAVAAGARVLGYLHWTLLDNWEWASGYEPTSRNGLLEVDRTATAGELPRALNHGALAFRHFALGGDLQEAKARYGYFGGGGSWLTTPEASPGVLWSGQLWLYLTRLDRSRLTGLLFDGGWWGLESIEWEPAQHLLRFNAAGQRRQGRLVAGKLQLDGFELERDWREGVWRAEDEGAPLAALHVTGLGRWDLPGAGPRWLAKTWDGFQWRACAGCELTPEGLRLWLGAQDAGELFDLEAAADCVRLRSRSSGWALVRLPDGVLES